MDKSVIIKIIGIILAAALLFVLGIYVGKKTTPIKTITKTEYVKGKTIYNTIDVPRLVYFESPIDTADIIQQCVRDGVYVELFPEKTKYDTLYLTREDTTKILSDWATKRVYQETLFDSDTLGTMKINTSVQYNRLGAIDYSFTPVVKTTTTTQYIERKILPFVGIGASTFPSVNAEAGMFINKSWGFSLSGNYYLDKTYETVPKYDFGVKILKMF